MSTYYVATNGNNSANGSYATPWLTIQHAVDTVIAGDTIVVKAGTYLPPTATVDAMATLINNVGTSGAPITIKAETWLAAKLDGNATAHSWFELQVNSAWIIIDGFEITNTRWMAIIANSNGAKNCTVKNCWIHHIGNRSENYTVGGNVIGMAGIYTDAGAILTVNNNRFAHIGRTNDMGNGYDHSLYAHGAMTIRNNIFLDAQQGWHIQMAAGFSGAIRRNWFFGPNGYGDDGQIQCWGADGNIVIDSNVFYDPANYALGSFAFTFTSLSMTNNHVYGTGVGFRAFSGGTESGTTIQTLAEYAGSIPSGSGVGTLTVALSAGTAALGGGLSGTSFPTPGVGIKPIFGQGQFGQVLFGPLPGQHATPIALNANLAPLHGALIANLSTVTPPTLGPGALSSLLIAGVEFNSRALLERSNIVWDISSRIGTASFVIKDVPEIAEIEIGAEVQVYLDDSLMFGGYISQIQPQAISLKPPYVAAYLIMVRDYSSVLDSVVINTSAFSGPTDKDIITTIMTSFMPSIGLGGVDAVVSDPPDFVCEGVTIRSALENMSNLTGAEFWVDHNKILQYHAFGAVAAPFSISHVPDFVNSFPAFRNELNVLVDGSNLANKVTVMAKGMLTVTREDLTSQSLYGLKAKNIVDRSLAGVPEAQARAQIELFRFAYPQVSGSFTTLQGGLRMGQALSIYWPVLGINGTYMVRRVSMTWLTKDRPKYAVEFGDYRPDLVKTLRALSKLTEATASTNPGSGGATGSTDGIIAYA